MALTFWRRMISSPQLLTFQPSVPGHKRHLQQPLRTMEYCSDDIYKIQKRLSGSEIKIHKAVKKFMELPDLHCNAYAYLDAILREKYQHGRYQIGVLIEFLRELPHPEQTLDGCWVLHQVDSQMLTSGHRQHSLALPFFIYELMAKLHGTPSKARVDQSWFEWYAPSIHALVYGHAVQLESITRRETLYAPADDLKFDSERRFAFTWSQPWTPGPDDLEARWQFRPGNDEKTWFYVVNAKYSDEYLYASDKHHDRCHRGSHFAFSRCGGSPDDKGRWELHAFSRDVFALYNREYDVYLYASDEMRDSERRFALTVREDSGHLNENHKWLLRPTPQ